ncbi:hypothetical protein [Marivivens donghaensis]|jgi:hypothetical protein|uniref:hypothetical protein n=1 Tax=Marivivens donghaensis TaxID=1699413 RepID=UPI003F69FE5E
MQNITEAARLAPVILNTDVSFWDEIEAQSRQLFLFRSQVFEFTIIFTPVCSTKARAFLNAAVAAFGMKTSLLDLQKVGGGAVGVRLTFGGKITTYRRLSGQSVGFYPEQDTFARRWKVDARFEPAMEDAARERRYAAWKRAVAVTISAV